MTLVRCSSSRYRSVHQILSSMQIASKGKVVYGALRVVKALKGFAELAIDNAVAV